jgi:hypothetical protein
MFLRSLEASVLLRGNRLFERATELDALNGNLCWQQQNREQPSHAAGTTVFGAILPAASVHPNDNRERVRGFFRSIEIKLKFLFVQLLKM